MRRRFFALLTAGALIFSSLIFGTSVVQAADTTGSISGTITLPDKYTFDTNYDSSVSALEVTTSGGSQYLQWMDSATIDPTSGKYTFDDLVDGHKYVIAAYSSSIHVSAEMTFLTTVYKDYGTVDNSSYDWDLSKITQVTATAKGTQNVNFTMAQGAIISGTIKPTDAENAYVAVCEVQDETDYTYLQCQYPSVNDDNTYSATVTPGSKVVVEAWADGYLYTWLGGLATAGQYDYQLPDNLNDHSMTTLTAPAAGVALTDKDINLTKAAVVTGKITPSNASNIQVSACQLADTGNSCRDAVIDNGTYTVSVAPGADVVIYAKATGYLYSFLDGTYQAGDYINLDASVTALSIPAEGGTISGKDITLEKEATISGTVTLPKGYSFNKDQTSGSAVVAYEIGSDGKLTDTSSYADLNSDGKYTINALAPGKKYVVAVVARNLSVTPNDFTNTAFGGYASGSSPSSWDPSTSGIQVVTADTKGSTANITLATGAIIKGTITPHDSDMNISVTVCEVGEYQALTNCTWPTVDSNGAYSAAVTPGSTATVYATADGYLYTWLGQYLTSNSSYYYVPSSVTTIVTSANGGITDKQDITLEKAYSISGTVSLPDGYSWSSNDSSFIAAYKIDDSSGTPQIDFSQNLHAWSTDGTYLIDKLSAGKYIVLLSKGNFYVTPSYGLITTAYGGYASTSDPSNWDLTNKAIKTVTIGPDSADGINFTMVKGDIVSTKVTPTDAQNVYVSVCEVTTNSSSSNQLTTTCTNASQDSDGNYSAGVTPGAKVIIYASADGYLSTYLGGYVSGPGSYFSGSGLPSNVTQVTAPSTNNTIALQKATSISGKVTLPDGYTFSTGDNSYSSVYAFPVTTNSDGTKTIAGSINYVSGSISATDGSYTIGGLVPGSEWLVAVYANNLSVTPSNDFMSTAYGPAGRQYASSNWPGSWDPTASGITTVTPDANGATDINIDMQTGFIIKGTISPKITPSSDVYVQVCSVQTSSSGTYQYIGNCVYPSVDSNGNYSAVLDKGSTAVVYATAPGYFYTWFGGYASGNSGYDSSNTAITQITDPNNGKPLTGVDITLAKASSISGKVTLPAGYSWSTNSPGSPAYVMAYEVTTASDGTWTTSNSYGTWTNSDGTYTIDKLTPGNQYVVAVNSSNLNVSPNDFLNTAHGGYASLRSPYGWDPTSTGIDLVTVTDTPVTGVNITMAKGDIVSGTIYPTNAKNVQVEVCEVTATNQMIDTCANATVKSDGTYSAAVSTGAVVVIQAKADDYLYTWYGTYSDSRDTSYGTVNEGAYQVKAPTSGRNITLTNGVAITGKVTLPSGYTLSSDYSSAGYVQASEVVRNDDGTVSLGGGVSGSIAPDGTYRISGLKADTPYVVFVTPSSLSLSKGQYTDLLTVAYGGYTSASSLYYSSTDLTDPLIGRVTLPVGQTKTVNLAMPAGGKITGTLYMPDGKTPVDTSANYAYVYCVSVDDYNNGYVYSGNSGQIASDGTYSCAGVPGKAYVIRAEANGYPDVWRGQYVGDTPTLPDSKVTQVTAPAAGKTVSAQDITLVDGSSISGKLIYDVDPTNPYANVQACTVSTDGTLSNCQYTSNIGTDGSFTINGMVPGSKVVLQGNASGYMTTWYGGVISNNPDTLSLKTVTAAQAGKSVTGVTITLGKPVTITGTISPESVYTSSVTNNTSLTVYACPTYTQDGQGYYRTSVGGYYGGGRSALPAGNFGVNIVVGPDDPNQSSNGRTVDSSCTPTGVSSTDGTYSMQVAPGVDYVVFAQATGFIDAWHGGLLADSGLTWDTNAPDSVLPASGYTLVSGKAGDTLKNVDITFGQSVTVTFDAGEGLPTMLTRLTPVDETVTLPSNPTRDGYVFGGWYTEANGAGSKFTADTVVSASQTVYAYWVQNVPQFKVTFVDGQGNTLSVTEVVQGGAATPPADPVRPGYIFKGWDVKFDTVNSNMTVTAKWVEAAIYKVTFMANGGKGSMDDQLINGGDNVKLVPNAFVLDGKIFKEWTTAADGTGKVYKDNGPITINSDLTLYAQWRDPATFDVTFVDGIGHTWGMKVQEGRAAPAPADPVRDGYTFMGWDTAFNDVRQDLTINAVWKSNTPEEGVPAPTGGTSVVAPASNGYLLILAAGCVLAGLLVQRLSIRRTTKRG